MKIFRFLILIPIILVAVIYYSCDDSGVLPSNYPRGSISFSHERLKQLNLNTEGVYELWLRLDSLGSVLYYSLGKFNIDANGNVINTSGGTMEFKIQGDTSNLGFSTDAFITVEPPGDNNSLPSTAVLLSGQTEIKLDSLYARMRLNGSLALSSAGTQLLTHEHGRYMLNTPTSPGTTCSRGVWFCDTSENTGFPQGLQMTSPGWVYQGWIVDKTVPGSPVYYSTGRFTNPYGPDFDGAGPCSGTGTPYSKPGQDWVQNNCTTPPGLPPILNIANGKCEVFVSIEPAFETPSNNSYYTPFIKVYWQDNIVTSIFCTRIDNLFSQYSTLPEARVRISY